MVMQSMCIVWAAFLFLRVDFTKLGGTTLGKIAFIFAKFQTVFFWGGVYRFCFQLHRYRTCGLDVL